MKLELKHLAPYLPYGLNWDISETEYGISEIKRLKKCVLIGLNNDSEMVDIVLKTNIVSQNKGLLFFNINTGKPILRNLSDLTKEIEVNGESFVPINKLIDKLFDREPESFSDKDSCMYWMGDHLGYLNQNKGYDNLLHWIYQDLIKWHFNVFNFPDDLFIDINTIKQ